jgi:hypothetical protein
MSRGEMIRNLDSASNEVLERLTNGTLEAEERHALRDPVLQADARLGDRAA